MIFMNAKSLMQSIPKSVHFNIIGLVASGCGFGVFLSQTSDSDSGFGALLMFALFVVINYLGLLGQLKRLLGLVIENEGGSGDSISSPD